MAYIDLTAEQLIELSDDEIRSIVISELADRMDRKLIEGNLLILFGTQHAAAIAEVVAGLPAVPDRWEMAVARMEKRCSETGIEIIPFK